VSPESERTKPEEIERTDSFNSSVFQAASALKAAPETFHPILICMSGEVRGQRFRLQREETILGRSRACEVHLNDGGTSRQHARIVWENFDRNRETPICHLEDLGSRNGTELNGVPVRGRVLLTERDRITVGRSIFGFFLRDTEELMHDESLYLNATRDALTGLDNRYQMLSHLKHYMALANRRTLDLCLLLIDVDHFKRINDDYGHNVGDDALRHLAALLARNSRESDLVARWGGEEFAVSVPDSNLESALRHAERIREAIEAAPLGTANFTVRMSVSIGVAVLHPGDSLQAFFDRADKALYEAKRSGRNRVVSSEGPEPPTPGY
jgi:diguanylate cyclase (GGDEF)-like protein